MLEKERDGSEVFSNKKSFAKKTLFCAEVFGGEHEDAVLDRRYHGSG